MTRALILIDLQIDFCPGGALAVPQGDEIIPLANRLMEHFDLIIATQDWHPAKHGSFAANHPWRKPGQVIQLNGLEQILWPMHCVQGSFGAEFAPKLNTEKFVKIFRKGEDPGVDSYSAFFDNGRRKATGLGDYLQEKNVSEVYLMGLATDYCVKYSVLDALDLGFQTNLIVDACRGIDLNEGDVKKAIEEMVEKGAIIVRSEELMGD